MQGCQKFLYPSQLQCLPCNDYEDGEEVVMEEKTKISATKSNNTGWRLLILFRWIIGLTPPLALYPVLWETTPPQNTHTFLLSLAHPPMSSFLSSSHFHISCERLLFDYLLCCNYSFLFVGKRLWKLIYWWNDCLLFFRIQVSRYTNSSATPCSWQTYLQRIY